jgi:hypothetical protein
MKGDDIIAIAKNEIGYTESPADSNLTKYGEWFKLNGQPWCAIFASWCYDQAGVPLENIGFLHGYAGVQTGVNHFKATNQMTISPIAGDLVFYDWQGDGHYDHTGLFSEDFGDHFEAVEGNTSLGNQSNGGEVMLRERHYTNVLFAHPNVLNE